MAAATSNETRATKDHIESQSFVSNHASISITHSDIKLLQHSSETHTDSYNILEIQTNLTYHYPRPYTSIFDQQHTCTNLYMPLPVQSPTSTSITLLWISKKTGNTINSSVSNPTPSTTTLPHLCAQNHKRCWRVWNLSLHLLTPADIATVLSLVILKPSHHWFAQHYYCIHLCFCSPCQDVKFRYLQWSCKIRYLTLNICLYLVNLLKKLAISGVWTCEKSRVMDRQASCVWNRVRRFAFTCRNFYGWDFFSMHSMSFLTQNLVLRLRCRLDWRRWYTISTSHVQGG